MFQRLFLIMVFGSGLCTLPCLKTCPSSAQRVWHFVFSFSKTLLPRTNPSSAQGSPLAWNVALPASGLGSNWVFTPYIVPTMTGCTRLALIIEDNFGPFGIVSAPPAPCPQPCRSQDFSSKSHTQIEACFSFFFCSLFFLLFSFPL